MRCSECVYGVRTGANLFCAEYDFLIECEDANGCESYEPIRKPRTNADRIRAMTDEELAEFLCKIRGGCRALTTKSYVCDFYKEDLTQDCNACWLDWLKEEAENAPQD